MAERVVRVTLSARVAEFKKAMQEAAEATRTVGTAGEKLTQQRQAFNALGAAALGFGTAASAATVLAIARFAEFEKSMSAVQAATHESESVMALLRDTAIEAGETTAFTAAEAAGGVEELAKAGVQAADIVGGGLAGALSLAAAGNLEVARAAEIAATAMTQFNLSGQDVQHVADLFAAGAGKAQGSVDDLSQAFNQSGLVASQMGLSVEETTGALAAFASAGLIGSDAGTSFRNMLLRLASPTGEAAQLMEDLGIQAYSTRGNFVGVESVAGQLQERLGGLTQAQRDSTLATLFGQDAIRAANVLYIQGAEGVGDWVDAVDDAGYAAETARIRMDNLSGDVERLGGAFDTALINTGAAGNDVLRGMVQALTNLVDLYNEAPEPIQATTLGLGALTGAAGIASGAFFLGVPKLAEFNEHLATLGPGAQRAGALLKGAFAPTTAALATAGLALTVYADIQAAARERVDRFTETIDAQTGAVTESAREMVEAQLATQKSFLWMTKDSPYDAAEKLGLSLDTVTDAALGNAAALREIQAIAEKYGWTQEQLQSTGDETMEAYKTVSNAVQLQSAALEEARRQQDQKNASDGDAVDTSNELAQSYLETATKAEDLAGTLSELIERVNEYNGVGQGAVTANASYLEGLEKAREFVAQAQQGVEGYTLGLDENTAAGAANAAMLAGLAEDSQNAADKMFEQESRTVGSDQAMQNYQTRLSEGRQAVYDLALALSGNAEQAQILTDKIYAMPSQKQIDIMATTAQADAQIFDFVRRWEGKTVTLQMALDASGGDRTAAASYVRYTQQAAAYLAAQGYGAEQRANGGTVGEAAAAFSALGYAAGGTIPGIGGGIRNGTVYGEGTSKSDSVLVRLSRGEEVIQEPYASEYRSMLKEINSGVYAAPQYGNWVLGASHHAPSTVRPVIANVSLEGATLVGKMDGTPFRMEIEKQILAADASARQETRMGWQP